MFLFVNVLKTLFLSRMAKVTAAPLPRLEAEAAQAHARLKALGEPKTAMDAVKYVQLKAEADKADEAYLAASDRAEAWGGRKAKPAKFVPSYLGGKLDAAAAGVLVYPYVPQVIEWVKGVVG